MPPHPASTVSLLKVLKRVSIGALLFEGLGKEDWEGMCVEAWK